MFVQSTTEIPTVTVESLIEILTRSRASLPLLAISRTWTEDTLYCGEQIKIRAALVASSVAESRIAPETAQPVCSAVSLQDLPSTSIDDVLIHTGYAESLLRVPGGGSINLRSYRMDVRLYDRNSRPTSHFVPLRVVLEYWQTPEGQEYIEKLWRRKVDEELATRRSNDRLTVFRNAVALCNGSNDDDKRKGYQTLIDLQIFRGHDWDDGECRGTRVDVLDRPLYCKCQPNYALVCAACLARVLGFSLPEIRKMLRSGEIESPRPTAKAKLVIYGGSIHRWLIAKTSTNNSTVESGVAQ
jgi:hypothetical protein